VTLKQITLLELLALFDESVHAQINALAHSDPEDLALVVFENLDMSSSALGERSVLIVGPNRTYKTPEACEGQRIGDVPSRFKYATQFCRLREVAQ
jgi:hypothetical protein